MQCIRPLKATLSPDNKIVFDQKQGVPGLFPMELPCRKCLPCRLNNGREKAIRAYHETKTSEDSIFLTLTYSDEHLESPRLIYEHAATFMKDLRNHLQYHDPDRKIDRMVTGEYGEKNKRPHWHFIIFNWSPQDKIHHRTTDLGHKVYKSALIDKLWGRNNPLLAPSEFGEVTLDAASYVARYAAKKLVHGKDQDHDFHPIHKTPSKRAMGRTWIEKYYKQTFELGYITLPNGEITKIPRYYVDWCKKQNPSLHNYYVTKVLPKIIHLAEYKKAYEDWEYLQNPCRNALTRSKVKETILNLKFKGLQERLKL